MPPLRHLTPPDNASPAPPLLHVALPDDALHRMLDLVPPGPCHGLRGAHAVGKPASDQRDATVEERLMRGLRRYGAGRGRERLGGEGGSFCFGGSRIRDMFVHNLYQAIPCTVALKHRYAENSRYSQTVPLLSCVHTSTTQLGFCAVFILVRMRPVRSKA